MTFQVMGAVVKWWVGEWAVSWAQALNTQASTKTDLCQSRV